MVLYAFGVGLFCPGGTRPPTQTMIIFTDEHREVYGVESIARVLPIAPATYYEHRSRMDTPARRPAREQRDAVLCQETRRVFEDNFRVYGVGQVCRP